MYRYILMVLISLCSLSVFAQSASHRPCTGKVTQLTNAEILEYVSRAQQAYSSLKGFTAKFSQTAILSALNAEEQSNGIVYFISPGKLRFDYKEPDTQIFVLNGKEVKFYQEFDAQMMIQKVEDVLISELPIAFLAGVGDLRKAFTPVNGCRRNADIALTMAPKDKKDQNLQSFTLMISPESYRPKGAYIVDISGNTNYIVLSAIKDSPLPNNALFDFTPPKGTDIISR